MNQPQTLPAREAAEYLGYSTRTLARMRKEHPTPIPFSKDERRGRNASCLYLVADLDAYLARNRRTA